MRKTNDLMNWGNICATKKSCNLYLVYLYKYIPTNLMNDLFKFKEHYFNKYINKISSIVIIL